MKPTPDQNKEAYHQAIWGLHRLREALLSYDHPDPVTRTKALTTARRELAETLPAVHALLDELGEKQLKVSNR